MDGSLDENILLRNSFFTFLKALRTFLTARFGLLGKSYKVIDFVMLVTFTSLDMFPM